MEPDYKTSLLEEPKSDKLYREEYAPSSEKSPDNGRRFIKLSPIGQRAVNGVYSSYDSNFPLELEGIVPKVLYEKDMERFNHRLTDYWPCPFCFGFGYF